MTDMNFIERGKRCEITLECMKELHRIGKLDDEKYTKLLLGMIDEMGVLVQK